MKRECDVVVELKIDNNKKKNTARSTHRVHLDFAFGLEQQPPDGHAHEIRSESRPGFVVDFVE